MLLMTAGFLLCGPTSGYLSDRFGARPFATGWTVAAAATFAHMPLLPPIFEYLPFGLLLFANGLAMGLFSAPNTAGIMNSVPAGERGVASGMHITFIFAFIMMLIAGVASWMRGKRYVQGESERVPAAAAGRAARPPMVTLGAAYGDGAGEIGRALARELGVPLIERAIPPSFADRISGPLNETFQAVGSGRTTTGR